MNVQALEQIEWGSGPPPKASNGRRADVPVPSIVAAAALQRPGVWGSYETNSTGLASRSAHRLREYGLDAVSRGTRVYFRAAVAS